MSSFGIPYRNSITSHIISVPFFSGVWVHRVHYAPANCRVDLRTTSMASPSNTSDRIPSGPKTEKAGHGPAIPGALEF